MYFPSNSSELTVDFQKPRTVEALERFDPDLLLCFSRRVHMFQVMRKAKKLVRYDVPEFGRLAVVEPFLVWVTDWKAGLEGRDDPEPLLKHLYYSDTLRFPNLKFELEERAAMQRLAIAAYIHAEYRHAFLDNRRLLERAFAPLFNSPSFVR